MISKEVFMEDKTLEQLDELLENHKSKLSAQILEIVDLITGDLPDFVLKTVRHAFIEDVNFSEQKSDEELSTFKKHVSEFGQSLSSELRQSLLADMNNWWGQQVSAENSGKSLDGNTAIKNKLNTINQKIAEFIQSEHLQPVEINYKTPARFIEGKYLPGMVEKYWKQLQDLRAVEAKRAELDFEARKARLAQRWDAL
jgi:hypothetical protein